MKIVFDARTLGNRMHGISRYSLNLLQRLLAEDQGHEFLILTGPSPIQERFNPAVPVRWLRTPVPLYSLQEQLLIPFQIRRESFDLYHSPTYTIPLALAKKGILTIHDLIPLLFPKDFGFRHRLFFRLIVRQAISRCLRVFTVSDRSGKDILAYLQGRQGQIVITPNGLASHWEPKPINQDFIDRYGLGQGFLLFVGNPKPHKNFSRVLSAFELLVRENHYPGKLVSIGLPPGNRSPVLRDRILFIPHCDDQELDLFYSGAELLAAPSLYEGFGLPVLEAMACGCPVLISDQGALPEVAGEAGFQVNPYDIRAIKEGMETVLFQPDLRQSLKDRGIFRAGQFTWEKAARIVLETYKSLDEMSVR
ncbi:MAG: glycosyltransferase family 4 protein [Deltaproteobacteria bacterium]|nr:glycosyltransferase family 4 protein [Deltaproteobacteria bacterium]